MIFLIDAYLMLIIFFAGLRGGSWDGTMPDGVLGDQGDTGPEEGCGFDVNIG